MSEWCVIVCVVNTGRSPHHVSKRVEVLLILCGGIEGPALRPIVLFFEESGCVSTFGIASSHARTMLVNLSVCQWRTHQTDGSMLRTPRRSGFVAQIDPLEPQAKRRHMIQPINAGPPCVSPISDCVHFYQPL